MEVSFTNFLYQMVNNPAYLIIVVLTLGAILANGWNDAPNAIATCVTTRTLSAKKAILLAAIFEFLGIFITCYLNGSVAQTIYNLVDLGNNTSVALITLCAALFSSVIWVVLASIFGIPTSASHALIAAITGSSIAIHHNFKGINGSEWLKVIYGLIISLLMGFILGYIIAKIIEKIFKKFNRIKTKKFFKKGQIVAASTMAFMHGAQDGQKFIGVFLLGTFLANGVIGKTSFLIPLWLIILCSLFMILGTSIGGYKIIKTVGMKMVKLETYQGFAADLAGAFCLFISSLFGIPVSTTHTKTSAVMGVGAAKRITFVNWNTVKDVGLTWILTFPLCGFLAFILADIGLKLF